MKDLIKGKKILVTGGTGFLGRVLTAEILKYEPEAVRIYSRDEVKHHVVQELFEGNKSKIRNFIGDVRDYERLKKATEGTDIVIHAAASKRVDILEYNVEESIKTNIMGSLNVVNACLDCLVDKSIFISSDKACSPVNTYGACKFVSERIFTEANYSKGGKKTVFSSVRYGNVLGSTGSVIPIFEHRIKNNEPIFLTDPEMTRFIISPDQAVQVIFKALDLSTGGEIFVPKLRSLRIIDLIELLKKKYNSSVDVQIIGARPGEKIHELIMNQSELMQVYDYENLYVIPSQIEKYQQVKKPKYIQKGKNVNEFEYQEYSSKDFLLDKNELFDLFRGLNLV